MNKTFSRDRDFLSNFYPVKIKLEIDYPSVEHAYQAYKTDDISQRVAIALIPTAAMAKKVGKTLTPSDWNLRKASLMEVFLHLKFFPETELAEKLLATGDEQLVEDNYWHDQYWGNCTCKKHKEIPGTNVLGKLLMKIREELNRETD